MEVVILVNLNVLCGLVIYLIQVHKGKQVTRRWPPGPLGAGVPPPTPGGYSQGASLAGAAILFADIRGFTTLTTQTELRTLARFLNAFFTSAAQIVTEHQGRVCGLAGDRVMAVFEQLDSHHASAGRAVEAALVLRRAFDELLRRVPVPECGVGIGVNQGGPVLDAWFGPPGMLPVQTPVGSAVNFAARLADRARPGEIWINNATLEQVAADTVVEEWQRVDLNVPTRPPSQPIQVFNVLGGHHHATWCCGRRCREYPCGHWEIRNKESKVQKCCSRCEFYGKEEWCGVGCRGSAVVPGNEGL